MKAKKRRNLGVIALIITAAVILAVCVVWVRIEKSELEDICSLCAEKLNEEGIVSADFNNASFYGDEFRGSLLGKYLVMAEKQDGKWVITKFEVSPIAGPDIIGGGYVE